MQKSEAAAYLAGAKQVEGAEASAPTNLHVISGEVIEKSEDGKVKVDLGGLVFSEDDEQAIEIDTLGGLEVGDTATILLAGQENRGMTPLGIGGVGTTDRVVKKIEGIEADYVKAELLEAKVAQIGFLKADSATITQLQAETAKIQNLTAEQLSAATAYIAALTAGSITAESLTVDVAKVHNLTADQLSAAAGYISQLTADSVTAQNISAMYGDFATVKANAAKVANLTAQELEADHATIASLDSNYAHITNGVIDNATIGYADVNNLSAHYAEIQNGHINSALINTAAIVDEQVFTVTGNKATIASIDASKINVTNLNADNITVNKINGQPVTGKSISDALTQHESDISTKVDTTTFNNTVDDLNDRIDGAIETFTGTVVPTLNNTPASAWTTTKLRDEHVGDVYYVVNSSSQQNGYCYRFTKSGSSYSWQLIKDSDVTAALSRLQTAEGKITTFDSDISTLKTDTGELKTKTQSLETSLGDKVDVTTFNELSSDVEENSATITTLSNTVSQKADSSTVTTLSNTVNQVKQTADTNKTSITNLTQTVNQKADSSTVTTLTQRTSTIEQNLNGITTRVGKTESTLETVSNPNLSPFFSINRTDSTYWHTVGQTVTDPDTRSSISWSNAEGLHSYSDLEGEWAHFTLDARTSAGNDGSKDNYFNVFLKLGKLNVEEGKTYTWLIEVRNSTITGGVLRARPSIGNATLDKLSDAGTNKTFSGDGAAYAVVTAKSDFSGITQDTRGFFYVASGVYADFDARISLYEGEYEGPYKPYVDQTLSNRVKIAETSIEQNAEDITLRATKAEFDALSIGGRNLLRKTSELSAGEDLGGLANAPVAGGYGGASHHVESTAAWTGIGFMLHTALPRVGAKAGDAITLSVWVSTTSETEVSHEFRLYRVMAQQNEQNINGTGNNNVTLTLKSGEWKRLWWTGTITDYTLNTSKTSRFEPTTASSGYRLLWSAPKVEFGNKPTDWTPAPEDMATAAELKVANDNINLKVSKNDVINQINVSTEGATIAANRVNIEGATIFSSGRLSQTSLNNAYDAKGAASTAVNNLQIGGRNLFLNSGRATLSGIANQNNSYTSALTVSESIPAGTEVTVSCQIDATNLAWGSSGQKRAGVEFSVGSSSPYQYIGAWAGAALSESSKVVKVLTGTWSGRISKTVTLKYDLPKGKVYGIYVQQLGSGTCVVSKPKLEVGNRATDWDTAPEDTVRRTQRIYYRKTVTGAPAAPSSWVVSSGDSSNAWTQKHISISSADKYIYTCEQYEMADGTLGNTSILLDDTITVIDGGKILTGSVEANALKANSLTLGQISTDAQSSILNSNVQVGSRNLLRKTSTLEAEDCVMVRTTVVEPGVFQITPTGSAAHFKFKANYLDYADYGDGEYTLSCEAKLADVETSYTSINLNFYIGYSDAEHYDVAFKNDAYHKYVGIGGANASNPVTDSWQRFSVTFNVPEQLTTGSLVLADGVYLSATLYCPGSRKPVLVRHVKLEKGNKASDWSPAPEDVDNSISSTRQDFNDQIDPINESIETLSNGITDQGKRLAATEDLLAQVKNMVDNLENTTSWLSFNEDNGLIIGDNPSDGSSFFYTQQKGSFMSFNQMTSAGSQQLMMLSGTNGVEAQKVTAEEVVTSRISSDWAISLEGDMFSIDYIGN